MKQSLIENYTVERKLPENFKLEDLPLFQHELKKTFGPVYLTKLQHAYVLNDLIFKPFRFFVSQSLSYPMTGWEQFKRLKYFFKNGESYDKCIWITDDWSGGYFHWLMDALPRLMICQEKIDGHLVLLNENHRDYRYVLDSLDKLGFKYVFYTNKCRIKELLLPDHVADSGNYLPSVFYKIRTGLLEGFSSKVPFRKIYVSRKTARFRRLLNEAEFVNLLKQYGFEIHYFENYTLKEQIALMQETKYFIGVHGNALANIYFMQPGTNVLELRFDNDKMNNCFFSLAAASQVNYYYQMGTGTSDDTHVADMQINVQEAEAIILRLLTK